MLNAWAGGLALAIALLSGGMCGKQKCRCFEAQSLSRGIVHNVCVYAVWGIGGLKNEA